MASVWMQADRYGKAMLGGNTQYPLTKEEILAMQSVATDLGSPAAITSATAKDAEHERA